MDDEGRWWRVGFRSAEDPKSLLKRSTLAEIRNCLLLVTLRTTLQAFFRASPGVTQARYTLLRAVVSLRNLEQVRLRHERGSA